jgi:hypothetical protein
MTLVLKPDTLKGSFVICVGELTLTLSDTIEELAFIDVTVGVFVYTFPVF